MSRVKVFVIAALLAAVAMVPFVLQRGTLNEVRAENARLQAQVAELTEELRRTGTNTAPANAAAANSISREQFNELMRLRAEVTALRKATNAGAPAISAAPALAGVEPTEQEMNSPAPIAEGVLTTNGPPWNHAGYARPGDTLSSMVWAMQQGRMDVLLNAATPEGQAQIQQEYGSKPNIVEKLQAEAKKVVEVRPSATHPSNENEAYMTIVVEEPAQQRVMEENAQGGNTPIPAGTVYTEGARRIERIVKLQRTGNDWRYAGSIGGTVGHSFQ